MYQPMHIKKYIYIYIYKYTVSFIYQHISSQHLNHFEGIMSTFGTYFPGVAKCWDG